MIRRMRRTKPAITRGHGSRRPCNASDTLTGHGERGNYALFPEKSEFVRIDHDPWNAVRLKKRPYFFLFVFGIEGFLIGFVGSATGGSRKILSTVIPQKEVVRMLYSPYPPHIQHTFPARAHHLRRRSLSMRFFCGVILVRGRTWYVPFPQTSADISE